jgi:hypothetical protein
MFISHTYHKSGRYKVTVKAKDIPYNAESNESYFLIRVPPFGKIRNVMTENHPPNAPKIKGKATPLPAKLYNYTFNATDPDGDNVSYEIEWGDGTNISWTEFYPSGEEIIRSHTYFITHTNIIKARAKDTQGAIGGWGYLFPGPKGKDVNLNTLKLLEKLLEKFPLLENLLSLLLV